MKMIAILCLVAATALSVAAECSDADKKAFEAFDHAWSVAGQSGDKAS